jgi:hypothetical protein
MANMASLRIKTHDYAGTERHLVAFPWKSPDELHPVTATTVSVETSRGTFLGIAILNEDQLRELHDYTGALLQAIEKERS